jgi:hypothetical protein
LEGYEINRVQENGLRFYKVTKGEKEVAKLPSVTTVLGNTKDMSGLDKWRKRVGEAEADRISTLSMNRGTIMHRLIELYKGETSGTPEERLAQLKIVASEDEETNQFKEEELGAFFLQQAWTFFL